MCGFVSWREMPPTWKPRVERRCYFLTKGDLASERGRELRVYLGSKFEEDKVGHGAIDWFYQLKGVGRNKECADFSSPENFPPEIVEAIKNGDFEGVGIAKEALTSKALADYEAKRAALDADCETKRAALYADYKAKRYPLDADYKAKRAALDADYATKRAALYADYETKRAALYADYKAKRDPLDADYATKRAALYADYETKRAALYADYKAKRDPLFWGIAKNPKNRRKEWR